MTTFIPYARPDIDDDDIAAVCRVLRSGWLTGGPEVRAFEDDLARSCGARHAIVCSSGTAALHLAMLACRVTHGQAIITSAITFLATANCARFVGAEVVFADIDPDTLNITPQTLAHAWTSEIAAVLPVHFAGRPCEMVAIARLARERGAVVIEDAAHAIGSSFLAEGKEWPIGGHPWADMTTLSFHATKTMTSAEGGAVLTADDGLAERCRRLRNHGMDTAGPAPDHQPTGDTALDERGPWYYEMRELGWNYRMSDVHAALGRSQLRRLPALAARRTSLVERYRNGLSDLPHIQLPEPARSSKVAWHLFILLVDFPALQRTRTEVVRRLAAVGVGTQVHYMPLYLHPYYRRCRPAGGFPGSEQYYRQCLSLPLHTGLSDADADHVIEQIRELIRI